MGGIFCGLPLLTALAVGCGAKVLTYGLIILGVPVLMYTCGQQTAANERANPDGKLEHVDEQGKEMAMTGPIPQNRASLPACHALAHCTDCTTDANTCLPTTSMYCTVRARMCEHARASCSDVRNRVETCG
jgi:hypothetical protein